MPPTASRRGWCSISPPPTATASCAPSRWRTARRAAPPAKTKRSARAGSGRRSAPAGRARSRPWRHRHRHQAASGEDEKDVVLEFALMLRDKLEKTGKYRVAMTRSDDTFIPLAERVRFARARKARAVHLDPCRRDPAQRGAGGGRHRLHAVGKRLRRRGRAARRSREQGRRDRRRRSHRRARRRRQYPDRSGAARDQDLFDAIRARCWWASSRPRRGCTSIR